MIRQFKYRGFRRLGPELAGRVIEKNIEILEKLNLDIIIPIPLHSYRLKSRGFNQAEILADIFSSRLNIPVDKEFLRKIKNTRDQKILNHDDREDNIRGAFKIFGNSGAGRNILLVDDVVTTGATMREARKVIRQAGGNVLLAAVVATAGLTT
jgi:ComF family protein